MNSYKRTNKNLKNDEQKRLGEICMILSLGLASSKIKNDSFRKTGRTWQDYQRKQRNDSFQNYIKNYI